MPKQVTFVISATLTDRCLGRVYYGCMQILTLGRCQADDGMTGVQAGVEHDILSNGITKAGDELVLSQQAFDTAFFLLPEVVDKGIEIFKGKFRVDRGGSHTLDIFAPHMAVVIVRAEPSLNVNDMWYFTGREAPGLW